jgi:regulator of sigma E protease
MFSLECETGATLTWVREGSPAWEAGMRPGDTITRVSGESVSTWEDIVQAGSGREKRTVTWRGDGESKTATLKPTDMAREPRAMLGVMFTEPQTRVRRYGLVKAMGMGVYKTYATVVEIVLTLRGFARQEVSPKNLGGVVTIAYVSYHAAQQSLAKLLYFMGLISASLAFLNILPIPVLDGGHLLFVAIEKVRGEPLSEKVMAISQYIGMALLLLLVIYVTKNDIMRLLQ